MTRKLFHEEEHKTQLAFANGFVESVYGDLNDIKHSFFRIGFRLCEAAKLGYYKTLGYANITDLALDKFNFSKSTTYELMAIHELARGETPLLMAPQYEEFSQSQLRELCRLKMDTPGFMRIVKPSDKVATIGFAVTFWNKYVFKHSGGPQVKNINDLLELDIDTPLDAVERVLEMRKARKTANFDSVENSAYAEKSEPEQENYDGQLPGQTKLSLEEETPDNSKFSAYAENSVVSDKEYDALIKDLDGLIAGKPLLTNDELTVYCLKKYGTGTEGGKFRLCDKVKDGDFTTSERTPRPEARINTACAYDAAVSTRQRSALRSCQPPAQDLPIPDRRPFRSCFSTPELKTFVRILPVPLRSDTRRFLLAA